MAAHRYVKPFIVAGLTGALSLGAPMAAFAEDATSTDTIVTADAAGMVDAAAVDTTNTGDVADPADAIATRADVRYELIGTSVSRDDYVLYTDGEWRDGENSSLFDLYAIEGDTWTLVTEGVTYSSSNSEVLYVAPDGLSMKTGIAGEATVTATYNGQVVASLPYTVMKMPLMEEYINQTYLNVQILEGTGLVVTGEQTGPDYYARVSAVSYDIAQGDLKMFVGPTLFTDLDYVDSVTMTSSNDAVAKVGEGGNLVDLVGAGSATLTVTVSFDDHQGTTAEVTRTIQVTVTDSSATETPENPPAENPPAETEQPKDEQKPQDTTDNKNKSDGEGLPETGDPAFVAMGIAGLAGVGAVAAGVRSRRRED